jgi:glyoxylase-like metal-dependent hydrolase (beta-lactamase superfamily II)
MNRRQLLRGLAVAPFVRLGWAQTPAAPTITVTKLSDSLYMAAGDGGNVGIVKGADGLMMIDGGLPTAATQLLKQVSENVDSHKVTLLFDTHWHFDHIGCNETLGAMGAKIMAHENVKKRLSVKTTMEAMNRTFDPLKPEGLPTQEFSKNGKMTFGTEKIEYVHIPTAHTDGDTFLFFPGPNVIHTGDLVFNGFYPVIDYSTGGWIGGMEGAVKQIAKVANDKTRIIPGHGPLATKADLNGIAEMLTTVHGRLTTLAKQGKSMDEVAAAAPLKDLDAKWGSGPMKPDVFLKAAYTSLLRHQKKA